MTETYDCIVLGVGGFGSGALDHLAARGVNVLGIERFGIAHDQGSSHGQTRVIRQAYFEHADYVPLMLEAYTMWESLERDSRQSLLHKCGLLLAGPADGPAVTGTRGAAEQHGLPLEEVPRERLAEQFPGFRLPEGYEAVFEAAGGYLEVEACVEAHIGRAMDRGAQLHTGETVTNWTSDGRTARVETDRGQYEAASLIITAGTWASQLLPDLPVPWDVVRKPLFWSPATTDDYNLEHGAGTFFLETPGGEFYGFPSLDGETVKLAEHTGGQSIEDPLAVDRRVLPIDLPPVHEFLNTYMPGIDLTPREHTVCMYTRTFDRNFVVDIHPGLNNVAIGAGFSGHGFKFTPILGAVLVDLALDGATERNIDFLSLARPGLL